ncbi:MAG: hypothetical protein QOG30_3402, partial [Acidimicrobiaceae bacterium]
MTDTEILERIERVAVEHLDEDAGRVTADIDAAVAADELPTETEDTPVGRLALALLFPVLGAAVMVGGVFNGVGGRIYAGVAGALGIGVALLLRRSRRPLLTNGLIVVLLFAIGVLMVIPSGPDRIGQLNSLVSSAASSGDVLRPPVDLTPGWQAIIGWLVGIIGFTTAWVAIVLKKPTLALLVPLPLTAFAGISVPSYAQTASGIAVLVLFAIGLGLLSSVRQLDGAERPPLGYELRKLAKAVPLIAVITVALALLSQTSFLFPHPKIDPKTEPQRPKTVPIDQVQDRVLFEVSSPDANGQLQISGPWRLGVLDVYDGRDWRLPAFNDTRLVDIPKSGVIDSELYPKRGVAVQFRIAGLGGAALPGLPNTVAVIANGPTLSDDPRTGTVRVANGQAAAGFRYTAAAVSLPTEADLRTVTAPIPNDIQAFLAMPAPPPAVQALIQDARANATNDWDRFNFLRKWVLENVTAAGPGVPVSITPDRAQDIISNTKEASPFEIVALQAMLARWAGVPARIGYGFDGGDVVNGALQVHPKNGASFVEVYFPGYKWLPVIGAPKNAKATAGNVSQQQTDPGVRPSDDIAVNLQIPTLIPPPSTFAANAARVLLAILIAALVIGATYVATPAVRKGLARARRRALARRRGPRARVALAYAEWRDLATDFGYTRPSDTPLMFLDRFAPDDEHAQLAWLTTRGMWGDLRGSLTDDHATAAEELSRALRRRLSSAQPGTMRFVAAVSRASLRAPFAPETLPSTNGTRKRGRRRALAAAALVVSSCAGAGRAGVRVDTVQANIVFGVKQQAPGEVGAPAAPTYGNPSATSPPPLRVPAGGKIDFEVPATGAESSCPQASIGAAPSSAAAANASQPPAPGLYRYKISGTQTVSVNGSDITTTLNGFEPHLIRNVQRSSDTLWSYEVVTPGASGGTD